MKEYRRNLVILFTFSVIHCIFSVVIDKKQNNPSPPPPSLLCYVTHDFMSLCAYQLNCVKPSAMMNIALLKTECIDMIMLQFSGQSRGLY